MIQLGFLSVGGDFSCDATGGEFLDRIDVGVSRKRSQMDPAEERRETKRQTELINMQGYVADSEYGIPTRCPCGGRIIDDICSSDDLLGKSSGCRRLTWKSSGQRKSYFCN
ncbi:hypothetical protein DY000_02009087 [Brassica cretica]|uniref:Uncharacterized protein n=1 Tax=Brassica cretica TaxID=69181 RepID=A0ABQ7CKV1_BRACR|nr:hypothetical protein DY000_02009087 [Brassica cretica]